MATLPVRLVRGSNVISFFFLLSLRRALLSPFKTRCDDVCVYVCARVLFREKKSDDDVFRRERNFFCLFLFTQKKTNARDVKARSSSSAFNARTAAHDRVFF